MKTQEIELQSQVTGEEAQIYYYNGQSYRVSGPDVAFLDVLKRCPIGLKFMLMGVGFDETEKYIQEQRQLRREDVATLFSKKWVFPEDGTRVNFNDRSLNETFFGYAFSKRKLVSSILNGSIPYDDLDRIEAFFENDNEIKEYCKP